MRERRPGETPRARWVEVTMSKSRPWVAIQGTAHNGLFRAKQRIDISTRNGAEAARSQPRATDL